MKYVENIQQVADVNPDYLGFIFYEKSKRNFEGIIPEISNSIKKTGVFVNEYVEIVISLIEEYRLDAIQLHGDESVEYIKELKSHFERSREIFKKEIESLSQKQKSKLRQPPFDKKLEIIKVFGIKDTFDFSLLEPYVEVVDYFLFDTKGKDRGGNGYAFNWSVLNDYPYNKPFFLSGGIGIEDIEKVKEIKDSDLPIYAVDVNSKFETKPGFKKVNEVKRFKNEI